MNRLKQTFSNIKQWFLYIVGFSFCVHKYKSFKVGMFPLVACYCEKCGTIKTGNCVYYGGTTYQTKLRGKQSIEYLKEKIEYLENRENNRISYKNNTGFDFMNFKEIHYLSTFETIERYRDILEGISN